MGTFRPGAPARAPAVPVPPPRPAHRSNNVVNMTHGIPQGHNVALKFHVQRHSAKSRDNEISVAGQTSLRGASRQWGGRRIANGIRRGAPALTSP